MFFELNFSDKATEQLAALEADNSKKRILKDVRQALALMSVNLRHPSLQAHEYYNYKGPCGEKVFECYAQENTPGAYRIFGAMVQKKACFTFC